MYQFKTNSITSLSYPNTTGASTFTAKATVQDVTNEAAPISLDGGASLTLNMIDNGDPGTWTTPDTFSVKVYPSSAKGGGLWFSSSWAASNQPIFGGNTVQQPIAGGNLVVHHNQLLQGAPNTGTPAGQILNQAEVQSILPQAIAVWKNAGVDVSPLKDINIQVGDLWSGSLAWSMNHAITFDSTAQGYGWSTDVNQAPKPGTIDLLTVLTHELGLQLGFQEGSDPKDVMAESLAPGVRRLNNSDEVTVAAAQPVAVATSRTGQVDLLSVFEDRASSNAVMSMDLPVGVRRSPEPTLFQPAIAAPAPTVVASPSLVPLSGSSIELDGSVLRDLALEQMTPTGPPLGRRAKK